MLLHGSPGSSRFLTAEVIALTTERLFPTVLVLLRCLAYYKRTPARTTNERAYW